MFLFNGENNNKLHASRNSGESRKLIQEGEGKFYGAMSLRRYQEMGVGCCAQGSGAQEQMVGEGGGHGEVLFGPFLVFLVEKAVAKSKETMAI